MAAHIGIPPAKLFVVNNPIGRDFESAALQMPVERPENTVLSLGTMGREKGVMDILAAAAMMPKGAEFKIQIAGPEREPDILRDVRQYIAEHALSGRIEIKPSVWGGDKIRLFREASIFLLPSYFENFPLVVLEAAAAGMAIVTTPIGATPEFFKNGVSALFVEPGNPGQIAAALSRLIGNPEERLRLGRSAREVFTSKLARSAIMLSLDRAYNKLLSPRDPDQV